MPSESAIRHPLFTGSCIAAWKQIWQLKKQKAPQLFFLQCQWYISPSKLVLSHITPPMSQNSLTTNLFTDPVWQQHHRDNIVIFCTLLGQCVKVAWWFWFLSLFNCITNPLRPTSNRVRIEPNGLRAWLRRRGLHWSCFCPLETGEPMSCQIVHGMSGNVSALCGQNPSHCGFHSKFQIS